MSKFDGVMCIIKTGTMPILIEEPQPMNLSPMYDKFTSDWKICCFRCSVFDLTVKMSAKAEIEGEPTFLFIHLSAYLITELKLGMQCSAQYKFVERLCQLC